MAALIIIGAVLVLSAVLVTRALALSKKDLPAEVQKDSDSKEDIVISGNPEKKLSGGIQIRTVSDGNDPGANEEEFVRFEKYLEEVFPLVHKSLLKEKISDRGILFSWSGSDKSLDPVCMMAHYDVVPADGTEWTYLPFSGAVSEGYIWGRGTLDIKGHLFSLLEAAERLLGEGFVPGRTLLFAFGGDEEIGGTRGASEIVKELKRRGIHPAWVLDEGSAIVEGMLPFVKMPLALIGTAEKGRATFRLSVEGEPGHSAMPPKQTAIGILSRAVSRLERNPFPRRLESTMSSFLKSLCPYVSFGYKLIFANLWLFKGVIKKVFGAGPRTDALIRTTQAVTVISGGVQENVIPRSAEALVNLRILPGETRQSAADRMARVIKDPRVKISEWESFPGGDPAPDSGMDGSGYKAIAAAVAKVVPEAAVVPILVNASTDSREYIGFTDHIYRFTPMLLTQKDLAGIHGIDERMSVENYHRCINFFTQVIRIGTAQEEK